MQQTSLRFGTSASREKLLSLTHPSRDFLHRHRAMLRRPVPAGFPLPAEDLIERELSLDDYLTSHRESTFFMRVAGESMQGAGIFDGDLVMVDRALPATHGSVVIAVVDGEFTVKQLMHTRRGQVLRAAHPDYPDITIGPTQDFSIWGVVQWCIHKV